MLTSFLLSLGFPALIGFLSFIAICYYLYNKNVHDQNLDKIPGPKPRYQILGNLDMFRMNGVPLNQSLARLVTALALVYEKCGIFKIYLGPRPVIILFRQNTTNSFLSSNTNIGKSTEYQFMWDWLGSGLLTSTGSLWKMRRRMLTPAFHFKILEDFLPIMNEQSDILVNNLRKATEKPFIDIREPIVQCTLDIICETAMGVSIGAQIGKNKEYLNSIHNLGETFVKRSISPWIWSDFIFYKTSIGKEFKSDLNVLHSMTRNVIKERKEYLISNKNEEKRQTIIVDDQDNIYAGNKKTKRMAFLDLLLDYHIENNALSLEDIREEVDTFMFEGHDTTAVSLAWTLYLLGRHPEVQTCLQEELDSIFGDNKDRDITAEDLKQMNYLECVIKESLRLYPSVPLIGRTLTEDMVSDKYVIPKGTVVYLLIDSLHYDPQVFPQPLQFRPERFLDKSTSNINAYSYVPFSAGPRSCIGKRFALNEEKIILSKIFLNFNLLSLDPRDRIISSQEMINRAKVPLRVQITAR